MIKAVLVLSDGIVVQVLDSLFAIGNSIFGCCWLIVLAALTSELTLQETAVDVVLDGQYLRTKSGGRGEPNYPSSGDRCAVGLAVAINELFVADLIIDDVGTRLDGKLSFADAGVGPVYYIASDYPTYLYLLSHLLPVYLYLDVLPAYVEVERFDEILPAEE